MALFLAALLFAAPLEAQKAGEQVLSSRSLTTALGSPSTERWSGARFVIQEPERTKNRGRGALWGAGIGFVAGGFLGVVSVESDGGDEFGGDSLVESAATGEAFLLGALVGAGLGAILGATVFAPSSEVSEDDGTDFALRLIPIASTVGPGVGFQIRMLR